MAEHMTSKRSIIIFWALFLVPTLVVAGFAFNLLSHEQDRIQQASAATLAKQAKTVSETIHLTIEDVQQNLVLSLAALDERQLKRHLVPWEETNPLVRNVFIFKKGDGLEYPSRGMESTKEERRFIGRYDALFSGRIAFDYNQGNVTEHEAFKPLTDNDQISSDYEGLKQVPRKSSRKTLVALSRVKQHTPLSKIADSRSLDQGINSIERSGWIPWFSENRLYILGWVQKTENGPVYGVELELMTLLSRLMVDFPELKEKNTALIMMDGNGNFMHQSGTLNVESNRIPSAVIPISSMLPHWRMAVFVDAGEGVFARGFLYVSVLLLGIFICAIISGGILLTRLTLKNMEDARQKTSFVSSVSHELKTPLTSIRMYAELLISGRVKDKEKTRSYLSIIVDESHRLTRLINNVLDFGKLEQGKKRYQHTRFELDEFLKSLIETHSIRIESLGLDIITQIDKGRFTVNSDRDAIEQVVLNLLDNAIKYAADGRFLKFILKKNDPFILLKICDDGPGIPKDQQMRIFEKFHRVDSSLSANQPGSGLGLSIAKQILQDLGGELIFEPMPENGSCFTARIKDDDKN